MNTPEEAAALLCPAARAFSAPSTPGCRGPVCMAWRYETITTKHPLWLPAVRAKAEELGEKSPYPKAAAYVAENKAELGMVPVKGFCGLGGQP